MAKPKWCCRYCGAVEDAEHPYTIGDKEPCITCGEGTAHVMAAEDARQTAAALELGLAIPVRSYTP